MLNISPRQLQIFVEVARSGSVRAAAERLHLSQPAASMALAQMERQLGAPVFSRQGGRLHVNPRGRELLPLAQELLQRYVEFGQRAAPGEALGGSLRLGTSRTVGNYWLKDLLGGFARGHAGVAIDLRIGNTEEVAVQLLDHTLDLGCVEGPVAHPLLELRPWREDALVICAPPDHPLARQKRLRPEHFAGACWILREPGSATRAMSERLLAQLPAGITTLQLDQIEAIKQAVIAGLGIACLPAVAVRDDEAAGRLCVLKTPFLDLRRTLSLVLHRHSWHSVVLEAFLASLHDPG